MSKIVIIPDTQKENIPEGKQGRFGFTYLHGKLETECHYDCYNILNPEEHGFNLEDDSNYITDDENKRGIYPCTYNGKDCTLFLWYSRFRFRGLVVYDDDTEAYQYAKTSYENNKSII